MRGPRRANALPSRKIGWPPVNLSGKARRRGPVHTVSRDSPATMRTLAAMTAHGQLVASRYGESVRRNRVEEHALGRTAMKLDDDVVDERQPLFRLVRKDLLFGALDVEL